MRAVSIVLFFDRFITYFTSRVKKIIFCVASLAARYRFDKVTDLAGGSNFVLLAVVTWCLGGNMQGRTVALNVMVIAWGLRLSAFLFVRAVFSLHLHYLIVF